MIWKLQDMLPKSGNMLFKLTLLLIFSSGKRLKPLLSLTSTVKHNDVEPRGRGLPASAATLSRG